MAHCCTICCTEELIEQPQIGDRGSNPGSGSQSVVFFQVGPHVLALFSHLLISIILSGLLHFV